VVRQVVFLIAVLVTGCFAQATRGPNVEAQRAAMRKLEFLVGRWSGDARAWRGGDPVEFTQTEEAQFKLDGLLLLIEGRGDLKLDGKPSLRALAIVSYDDEASVYRMRAYNDGRYMETELKLAADGKGASWGFTIGAFRTSSVLRINSSGEWTEAHELLMGSQPPRKLMEIRVKRMEGRQ